MQQRHDVIRLRVAPEHRLREDEVAVDVDVEDAVDARHHFDCCDRRFELVENPRCQTDSVRPRASGDAVLDANRGRLGHLYDSSGGRFLQSSSATEPPSIRTSPAQGTSSTQSV